MSNAGYSSTPGQAGGVAVLPPSPLDLGKTLSGAFRVMKSRLAQLIVLALLPIAVGILLIGAAAVPLVIGMVQSISWQEFSPLIALGGVLVFACLVITALINVKAQGMMALAAHDSATGRADAGLADLSARTRGLVGRVLLFYLLVIGVVVLVYAVIVAVMLGTMFTAISSSRTGGESAIAAVVGVWLLMMAIVGAMGLLAFYLQIRFLYFMPVLAVEGAGAIDSLRRSWGLTRNNVLRTLGYYLVASLIVSAANGAVSMLGQVVSAAMAPSSSQISGSSDPAQVLAGLAAMAPGLIIVMLFSMLVSLLAVPFLTCVLTVMYADQVQRAQLPNGGRGAYGAACAQPAPPAYPNQGYPNQGYPNQGQGWQQPPQQPGWGQQNPGDQGWGQPPYRG
ncbi:DUF7847 domain-containing protein [Enemella evansiae]|uniref:DUF7847 domain-containing protein n=1 Tax=Enemella evansiae TaxID=2016499 RepID=UPI0010E9E447|nr:glycerophosphoryl diester phosphodiesterase membrane domain-containing protein [Enemella evansiae]TDO86375.1 glycerophosphoryl diester phosphodiesterase family protein [Enemella evansiae]